MNLRFWKKVFWRWCVCLVLFTCAFILGACELQNSPNQVVLLATNIPKSVAAHSTHYPSNSAPQLVVAGAPAELLVERAGQFRVETPPRAYAMYWDYSGAGSLAFGSTSWKRADSGIFSVSDFWVYDYRQGEVTRWFPSNVGRVLWDPDSGNGRLRAALALFDPELHDFSLVIATAPGEARVVAERASYAFSWAPDGSRIAYVRRAPPAGLYVVSVEDGHSRKLIDLSYEQGGWLFDKPLWILERGVLIVADNYDRPVLVVPLDGSTEFTPEASDGDNVPGPRPDVMLWASDRRQLILSGESDYATETWVHTFSADLRIVQHSTRIAEAILKGWWDPGQSVLLLGPKGPEEHVLASP